MFIRALLRCSTMSTMRAAAHNNLPLVVVLGATGTGKSKLAIEIAQKFNGEIISADSMQVYKGLDIITNKVTTEERSLVRHHLIDFLDPLTEDFNVQQFRDLALETIAEIQRAGKLPIIVGGTHYYIESILWKVLLDLKSYVGNAVETRSIENEACQNSIRVSSSNNKAQLPSEGKSEAFDKNENGSVREGSAVASEVLCESETESSTPEVSVLNVPKISAMDYPNRSLKLPFRFTKETLESTEKLYEELRLVDPERASSLHPNERRKILWSLHVLERTGAPYSWHLKQQRGGEGGSVLGGGLRYPNTSVFWLQCHQDVLDTRLDERVDDMIQRGLLQELLLFHEQYNKHRVQSASVDRNSLVSSDDDQKSGSGCTRCDKAVCSCSKLAAAEGIHNDVCPPKKKLKVDDEISRNDSDSNEVSPSISEDSESGPVRAILSDGEGADTYTNSSDSLDKSCVDSDTKGKSGQPVAGDDAAVKALYTHGIFQSIGFKEFHDYLVLSESERESASGQLLYQKGIEKLKIVTRRYARRQNKWIRGRFTKDLEREVPPIYSMDTSDVSQWESLVHTPAMEVVAALVGGHDPPLHIQPMEKTPAVAAEVEGRFESHECTVCQRVFVGRRQWEEHLNSSKHRKVLAASCKRSVDSQQLAEPQVDVRNERMNNSE